MAEMKKENKKAEMKEEVILKKDERELNDDDMDKVAGGAVGQDRMEYIERKMEKL